MVKELIHWVCAKLTQLGRAIEVVFRVLFVEEKAPTIGFEYSPQKNDFTYYGVGALALHKIDCSTVVPERR